MLGIVGTIKERKFKLTKKDKIIKKNVNGFRFFIREYTLIKTRSIEYKELYEEYIAYALSLGQANVVEEFVKKNEQYRNLIYNYWR